MDKQTVRGDWALLSKEQTLLSFANLLNKELQIGT